MVISSSVTHGRYWRIFTNFICPVVWSLLLLKVGRYGGNMQIYVWIFVKIRYIKVFSTHINYGWRSWLIYLVHLSAEVWTVSRYILQLRKYLWSFLQRFLENIFSINLFLCLYSKELKLQNIFYISKEI